MNPSGTSERKMTERKKLGPSFHRSFALSRPGLRQIIEHSSRDKISYNGLRETTTLGTGQVRSSPNYALATGLLNEHKELTPFGRFALEHDPSLTSTDTQWVLHYNLSAPLHRSLGDGPLFWNWLIRTVLVIGRSWSKDSVALLLEEFERGQGTSSGESVPGRFATAFLGTYSHDDALGNLEILRDDGDNTYTVMVPKPPSAGIVACLLADYWAATWGDQKTVLLQEVTSSSLLTLLMQDSGTLNGYLGELQRLDLVQRQRKVRPYQVMRLWDDPAEVWQQHLFAAQ